MSIITRACVQGHIQLDFISPNEYNQIIQINTACKPATNQYTWKESHSKLLSFIVESLEFLSFIKSYFVFIQIILPKARGLSQECLPLLEIFFHY